jgi:uncharacterized protein (DUF1684 family)
MNGAASLWHWRRTMADLYGAIRRHEDPPAAHALWQQTRRTLFATHPQSPIEQAARQGQDRPHVYPYDPALRCLVLLQFIEGPAERHDAGADGSLELRPFARTVGLAAQLGGELTLYWIAGYGGGAFLPFADATSGRETYGAGRYLLDTIKGADLGAAPDGRTILDFNFAYYPSCAYSDRYVCPLAPAANRLAMPVRAGERDPPSEGAPGPGP